MSETFYLQDSRGLTGDNTMFWQVGGGYTSDIRAAEFFTKESAVAQNQCRKTDIPWPVDYIQPRHYIAVDMQYLRPVAHPFNDTAFYRQVVGRYVGNDVLWETGEGVDTDLRCAKTFPDLGFACVNWPVGEILKISRPAVRARDVSIKEALAGTGIVLHKPKYRPTQCCHCGCFISERQAYGDCPRCGGDNSR